MAVTNPDLEAQIAEQLRLAELAIAMAERTTDSHRANQWRDKARSHYAHMAGLISKRTDERVEEMERERGLR